MTELRDFKRLMDTLTTAVIVAEPVFDCDGECVDFSVIYVNDTFRKVTENMILIGDNYQTFKEKLTHAWEWTSVCIDTIKNRRINEKTFYSHIFDMWMQLVVSPVMDKYVVVTVTDVSKAKEYEQALTDQNKKLEALTAELSANRTSLDNQLRSIQTLNEQLLFAAYHDSLTNLYNRAWLANALKDCIAVAQKTGIKFGIILLNIDNMKDINDSRGHNAGDDQIRQAATLLRLLESKNVIATRFGGDEFVVLCKCIKDRDDVLYTGRKILDFFNAEGMGISGGISVCPDDTLDSSDLLKFADMAKVEIKRNGKNSVACFHSVMQEKFMRKLNIETKLTAATASKVFQLYYQPQFDIATDRLRGFEALLRWHDEDLGWISPEQFVPLAEEMRLVIPIGDWVMDTALSTLADWERDFDFQGQISVNVSPIQFNQMDFMDKFLRKIEKYKINPRHLEVEITEGVLIDNMQDTVEKLRIIKGMGIGISLDDFGTGYSSLRYLQILPLTTLKIDKSFISNIAENSGIEASITESIVALVSKMGLDTIAEGVETEEQLQVLKKFNCRTIQGFLRGKPMPRQMSEKIILEDKKR